MALPASTTIDGIGLDDVSGAPPQPGVQAGYKFKWLGQTSNTSAGNVANQGIGTIALPALASGATGTATVTDSLITANSLVFVTIGRGTTAPAAGAVAAILADTQVPTAGSCVIDLRNSGTAATLATDYILRYWVVN